MKKIFISYISLIYIYILSSCISDYEAVGLKDMSGLLVVEGIILEEGTKIFLSRTVSVNDHSSEIDYARVANASIQIIDEAYNIIADAEESVPGTYIVKEHFSFAPAMKYALDIRVSDKHYQSAFVEPLKTPEIDEVSWKLNDDYSIDIMVSTHDSENESLYCLWSFEEDWEIRAQYMTALRYDPDVGAVVPNSPYGSDNRYYCWTSDYSKSLLLATSEKFKNATIKDHKIHKLKPVNSRYSYLYSILVSQYSVDREAAFYFDNLQRNIDESGSIFAPQPSEKTGNVRCLSNPNETVIGYVVASKKTTSRLFIPMAELHLDNLDDKGDYCYVTLDLQESPEGAYIKGYGFYEEIVNYNAFGVPISRYRYKYLRCVDCTYRGGTKNKPDFWPNGHQ